MDEENVISGNSADEIWQQLTTQFQANPEPLQYTAIILQNPYKIVLDIDIDLGGGFESGYETTTLSGHLLSEPNFQFAIHSKHLTDEIGKFFGMEDIVIGYPEFDEKFIIKTSDAGRVKALFSDATVRALFLSLPDFTFGITRHHVQHEEHKSSFLELLIETGITDVSQLKAIYQAFYAVLSSFDSAVANDPLF